MTRKRTGYRVWAAQFERHGGTKNEAGLPTYDNPEDWNLLWNGGPIFGEFIGGAAGESVRGRQVTAQTTNVLIAEYFDGVEVVPGDRMILDGEKYEVVANGDPDGLQRELWIEVKREF